MFDWISQEMQKLALRYNQAKQSQPLPLPNGGSTPTPDISPAATKDVALPPLLERRSSGDITTRPLSRGTNMNTNNGMLSPHPTQSGGSSPVLAYVPRPSTSVSPRTATSQLPTPMTTLINPYSPTLQHGNGQVGHPLMVSPTFYNQPRHHPNMLPIPHQQAQQPQRSPNGLASFAIPPTQVQNPYARQTPNLTTSTTSTSIPQPTAFSLSASKASTTRPAHIQIPGNNNQAFVPTQTSYRPDQTQSHQTLSQGVNPYSGKYQHQHQHQHQYQSPLSTAGAGVLQGSGQGQGQGQGQGSGTLGAGVFHLKEGAGQGRIGGASASASGSVGEMGEFGRVDGGGGREKSVGEDGEIQED
jgi:hypothetical protein